MNIYTVNIEWSNLSMSLLSLSFTFMWKGFMCAFTCVLYAKLLSDLFYSLRVSYYNYQDKVIAHNFVLGIRAKKS